MTIRQNVFLLASKDNARIFTGSLTFYDEGQTIVLVLAKKAEVRQDSKGWQLNFLVHWVRQINVSETIRILKGHHPNNIFHKLYTRQ